MGFLDSLKNMFSKPEKKNDLKVTVITAPTVMPTQQASKPKLQAVQQPIQKQTEQQQQGSGFKEVPLSAGVDASTINRITDLESKVQKLELEFGKLSKDHDNVKAKLSEIDARLVEMLSMYELISNQMNPFVGDSRSLQGAVVDLQKETTRLREEFENLKANTDSSLKELKDKLNILTNDVNLLAVSRVNVGAVVKGIISKKNTEKQRKGILQHVINEVEKKKEVKMNE